MASATTWAAEASRPLPPLDLPLCEVLAPGQASGLSLGLVQPGASQAVQDFAARLSLANPQLEVCQEAWSSVLPRWWPWAHELERGHGWALFALAFVVVVTLLWRLTPREWWRRTTLLGVVAVAGLTWGGAVASMATLHGLGGQRALYGTVVSLRSAQQAKPVWADVAGARELEALLAQAGIDTTASGRRDASPAGTGAAPQPVVPGASPDPSAAGAAADLTPAGSYRTAHRLNLREGPGVQHAHLMTLPRGDVVQFDGARQGDWWRIRGAKGQVGWASSLWLRRPQEGLPADGTAPASTKG